MADTIDLHDLSDEDVALVKGLVERLRHRRDVQTPAAEEGTERDWGHVPAVSFAEDWDNDRDAAYDQWRERYRVPAR